MKLQKKKTEDIIKALTYAGQYGSGAYQQEFHQIHMAKIAPAAKKHFH
jgi:hypothetical protein